jgi:hypothetical protein
MTTAVTINVVGHPDRRDHRVEREDQVEDRDLHDHGPERRDADAALRVLLALELLVDLPRRFVDQEQPADDQDQVASADLVTQEAEERLRQPHHPHDREQQRDAGQHRDRQPQLARLRALVRRDFVGEDRDEDDVVDAEHDLEHRQGRERDPGFRVRNPIHQEIPT